MNNPIILNDKEVNIFGLSNDYKLTTHATLLNYYKYITYLSKHVGQSEESLARFKKDVDYVTDGLKRYLEDRLTDEA